MKKNIETQNVPAFSVKVGNTILFYGTPSAVWRIRIFKETYTGLICAEFLIKQEKDLSNPESVELKPHYIHRFQGENLTIITSRN